MINKNIPYIKTISLILAVQCPLPPLLFGDRAIEFGRYVICQCLESSETVTLFKKSIFYILEFYFLNTITEFSNIY